jgi:integrase
MQEVRLDDDAMALAHEIAGRTKLEEVTPMETFGLVTRLLQLLCQGGSPAGLAKRPPSTHPLPAPGQRRRLRPGAPLQSRESLDQPLLCVLADHVMRTAAERSPELAPALPIGQTLLRQVASGLDNLAEEPRWSQLLHQRPPGPANRLYDLHWHTAGYPAYRHLAYDMHTGLIAQIRKESKSGKSPDTIIHNVRTYTTAIKALILILDPADLLPALAALPDDRGPLRKVLASAASWFGGISDATRRDYVAGSLDIILCGAATREPRHGVSGFGRRKRLHFTEVELDPEAEPMTMVGHAAFGEAVSKTARIEDSPALQVLDDDTEALDGLPADDGDEVTDKRPQWSWYLGNRAVMDRYLDTARPGVFQPRELAEFYAAVRPPVDASGKLNRRLNRASCFLLLDLLIHTGRPADWLASLHLDTSTSDLNTPRYNPATGAIYYAPAVQPGIPERLLGEDDDTLRERGVHARAFEGVATEHILPLAPIQVALLTGYLDLRAQALGHFPHEEDLAADGESSPLLLLVASGRLRAWAEDDTRTLLCSRLTDALRSRHPGWPAVRVNAFRSTFTAHYLARGLDPIYALWISEHYYSDLEMPAIYSRVRAGALAHAYADAQTTFRSELREEYCCLLPDQNPSNAPLLWRPTTLPDLPPWPDDAAFGSWHCPRLDRVRPLIVALRSAAESSSRNDRVVLTAVLLTALVGLRPAEVCNLRTNWIDTAEGLLAVDGKANFAWTADRVVPISVQSLLEVALGKALDGPRPSDGGGLYLLWLDMDSVPVPLSPSLVDQILVEAGAAAGLTETQTPDWYSFRHLWRSTGLAMGIPFDLLNGLAGHQVLGRDLYNRSLDLDLGAALEYGRALAKRVAQILEYEGNERTTR